ncbi:MAG: hypothetical protein FJZ01_17300 [Candidatus Sericytochromatia bacterium]|nr:hypothetical protein [Candidatus Tanganyikabacteria bacterium]
MPPEDARTRRLAVDHGKLQALAARSGGALTITKATGTPPQKYLLTLRCKGIERLEGDAPVFRDEHKLEIRIPAAYPLAPPHVRLLTPIFHPHVHATSDVCIGHRWVVGEGLDNLIVRVASFIRCEPEYFDLDSVANAEAADWVEAHMALFPLQADPFGGGPTAEPVPAKRRIVWQDQRG